MFVMVAGFPATIKVFIDFTCRGASISFGVGWCGSLGRPLRHENVPDLTALQSF